MYSVTSILVTSALTHYKQHLGKQEPSHALQRSCFNHHFQFLNGCLQFPWTVTLVLMISRSKHIPGSAPSNKYGWFVHLRSCMRMFRSLILSDLPAPFTTSMSFIKILVYLKMLHQLLHNHLVKLCHRNGILDPWLLIRAVWPSS